MINDSTLPPVLDQDGALVLCRMFSKGENGGDNIMPNDLSAELLT